MKSNSQNMNAERKKKKKTSSGLVHPVQGILFGSPLWSPEGAQARVLGSWPLAHRTQSGTA